MTDLLTDDEQQRRSQWFREHWQNGVAFNRWCKMRILRWDSNAVEIALPYTDDLSAHSGIFHGGVVGALLDTTATAAVMAGHDFNRGSRLTTISMSVQYLSVAPGEDLTCEGVCTRRGRTVNFAQATARGSISGKPVASCQVAVNIAGERPGAPWTSAPA